MVSTALAARHLYARGQDYFVRDGEIVIIDPVTGRGAEGRQWSLGLHQLIALKRAASPVETETLNQITYQRFFPRYLRVGGMSGSLREVRGELAAVTGCACSRCPCACRAAAATCRRGCSPAMMNRRSAAGRVRALAAQGAQCWWAAPRWRSRGASRRGSTRRPSPIRYSTPSRATTRPHRGRRGPAGSVTVAPNMAGRGTDIRLDASVAAGGRTACAQLPAQRLATPRSPARRALRAPGRSRQCRTLAVRGRLSTRARSAQRIAGEDDPKFSIHPQNPLAAAMGRVMLALYQRRRERRERPEACADACPRCFLGRATGVRRPSLQRRS